eukprot:2951753-Amphidinium_carterae.1
MRRHMQYTHTLLASMDSSFSLGVEIASITGSGTCIAMDTGSRVMLTSIFASARIHSPPKVSTSLSSCKSTPGSA